jgi:AraC family transcriptional regulator
MPPLIKTIADKKLIGKRLRMSLSDNRTPELWRSFMPRRKEITNNLSADLFSLQVYDNPSYFTDFHMDTLFEKWAAIEVSDFNAIPGDMESYTLTGGLYAVFTHKGAAATGPESFRYIFGTWLPDSDYLLDDRAHFEILGEKYRNDDPTSEEEIWIPIRTKS